MSLKWPNKDPDEILDYSLDWSRYLDSGENITLVQWYIDVDGVKTLWSQGVAQNGLLYVSATNTEDYATIVLGDGTNNVTYKITCKITTNLGNVTERAVRIKIRDNY